MSALISLFILLIYQWKYSICILAVLVGMTLFWLLTVKVTTRAYEKQVKAHEALSRRGRVRKTADTFSYTEVSSAGIFELCVGD